MLLTAWKVSMFGVFLVRMLLLFSTIIMSECFYRIKVSVLYKYIQVKNCYKHLSCSRDRTECGLEKLRIQTLFMQLFETRPELLCLLLSIVYRFFCCWQLIHYS